MMQELFNFGLVSKFGLIEHGSEPGLFLLGVGSGVFLPIAALYLLLIIAGYLLGSLNAGIIISKLAYRDDIRKYGSGGAGATNMLRTYGKSAAAVTFMLDGIKTVAAVLIGVIFFGNNSDFITIFAGPYIGGLASIVGHSFPVYYKFKGGKSVAAAFFMVLCTQPFIALVCLAIFIGIVWSTKYVSVGSVMSIVVYPLILNRFTGIGLHNLIAVIIMVLIVLRHRDNIKRVWAGKENKISFRKKDKKSAGADASVPAKTEIAEDEEE